MKLSKISLMATVAAAVLSFSFMQNAEAGFGIKVPKIGNVVKSGSSGTSNNGNVVNKSVDVNNTIWKSFDYTVKNKGVPVAGAKIYKVILSNNARYTRGHHENGGTVWVYENIESSQFLGTTDANGHFSATNFPGGEVLKLVIVKEGWHCWTYTEERMRYKAPFTTDLNRSFPGYSEVRGLIK